MRKLYRRPFYSRWRDDTFTMIELGWLRLVFFDRPRPKKYLGRAFYWDEGFWPQWEVQFPRLDVRWNVHGWRP